MIPRQSFGKVSQAQGAALPVALILLLAITIVAVSAVMFATSDLRMVANQQRQERAFQAAETGVEAAMREAAKIALSTTGPGNTPFQYKPAECTGTSPTKFPTGTQGDKYCYTIRYIGGSTTAAPLIEGFSLSGVVQGYHFESEAEAETPQGGAADHTQGFYIIGPSN